MNAPLLAFLGPIGGPEMIMIFVVILLLFGAKKLPELARGIGKSMGEFKKAREDFEHEITRAETETRVKPAPDKEPRKESGDI
jgi:sec-independent protein translocase protein TatA